MRCQTCGGAIMPNGGLRIYCSKVCRKLRHNKLLETALKTRKKS